MRIFFSIAFFFLPLAGWSALVQGQTGEGAAANREYAIKAAFLYNFGHYVEWPENTFADSQSPFVIGVLGVDPVGDMLDEISRTKKINGRQIVVKRFSSMEEYQPCQILFVASSVHAAESMAAIQKAELYPVLLVGETPGFAERGGTFNFFIEENRVRFEVNMEVAKQEQLKISSKLLSLAKILK